MFTVTDWAELPGGFHPHPLTTKAPCIPATASNLKCPAHRFDAELCPMFSIKTYFISDVSRSMSRPFGEWPVPHPVLPVDASQASVLVRSLLKSERPSGLTQAIIEVGRINKTLYLLNYIDDKDYRRRILTQLNRGESRHAVARAICHGQKGEIRKRYTDGQEDQLGALGLVTNAVVLWNTIYMQAALDHLRAQGETLNDEDIARLSPLCHGHINMLGHYSFTLAELVTKGHLRPLKEASEEENIA